MSGAGLVVTADAGSLGAGTGLWSSSADTEARCRGLMDRYDVDPQISRMCRTDSMICRTVCPSLRYPQTRDQLFRTQLRTKSMRRVP